MNKFILKYKNLALVALAVLSLTSCLKDKGYENGEYGLGSITGGEYVTLPLGTGFKAFNSLGLVSKAGLQDVNTFQAVYDYVDPASEDITVTLSKDDAAITAYDATLSLVPTAALGAGATTMLIPKGKRLSDPFVLKINTSLLNPSKVYGLAFTVSSVSKSSCLISRNLKTVIYKISIKNIYDGNYTVTGYVYHPSAPRGVSGTKALTTVDPTTVQATLGDLGGSGYIATFTVNPNNSLTINPAAGAAGAPYTQMDSGLPTTNPGYTGQWAGSASCNNTYDPLTKTFKVRYGYMGGTGWRVTEEIMVKQ